MRALSIRQPFAELILRGIKTIEYRSRATKIIGERFFIYASKAKATPPVPIWSDDLRVATPPPWMIELAEQVRLIEPELIAGALLPTGVIVGSAVISECSALETHNSQPATRNAQFVTHNPQLATHNAQFTTRNADATTLFKWHLTDVKRIATPRKPEGHPQPVWWNPFG